MKAIWLKSQGQLQKQNIFGEVESSGFPSIVCKKSTYVDECVILEFEEHGELNIISPKERTCFSHQCGQGLEH
jgi:hypothetical protein